MKTVTVISALLLLAACDGGERPLSAACTPAVSVTIPAAGTLPHKAHAAAAKEQPGEVVQVYWDVSRSMRDFAAVHRARGGAPEEIDDLTPVVAALDSGVLLRAHAKAVEQYGVGESIAPLPSARSALHPSANRTVLHMAAEQIGTALANGSAQAALVVSDLELDAPPRTAANVTVCGGVPLPSTAEAGSLFGRCFENAMLAAGGRPLTRVSLLAHVFRKSSHGRELFVLLLATDRAFGLRISNEMVRRLDFSRQVIFDASAAANVRGCELTAPSPGVQLRSEGCSAKCFDAEATIGTACDVRTPASGAWVYPVGQGVDGVAYEPLTRKAGAAEERAVVRFAIPCSMRPGRFEAAVSFTWRARTPWAQDNNGAFARNPSVRDLFDSLADAIVRIVAPRRLRIGINLVR